VGVFLGRPVTPLAPPPPPPPQEPPDEGGGTAWQAGPTDQNNEKHQQPIGSSRQARKVIGDTGVHCQAT
jgi:hypothetical protein